MSYKLTIFTPTYNRADTLERLYESLKAQKIDHSLFEWLIVNDGSKDNTDEIVNLFINENVLNIRYYKQENRGKQSAWNFAVMNSNSVLFCCVDSDDRLHDAEVLSLILTKYYEKLLNDKDLVGIRALTVSSKTLKPSGKAIATSGKNLSYFEEIADNSIIGERIDILKTKIIKNYLYPVQNDIKFIPEIWFYVTVAKDGYKFLYVPDILGFFYDETEVNRLTRSSIKMHAKGHYISRSNALKFTPIFTWLRNPIFWIKTLVRFSQTAMYTQKKINERIRDTNIIYALLSYPFGLIKLGFGEK